MKFLSWLFDFADRHLGDARRYERGGTASRILLVIFLALMSAGSIGIEFWGFELFKTSGIGGFFALLLAAGIGLATLDLFILYAYLGFSRAAAGTLDKLLAKGAAKKKGKSAGYEPSEKTSDVPKGLDVFVGIFSVIGFFALIAGAVAVALYCVK